jgi:hypothetical protein
VTARRPVAVRRPSARAALLAAGILLGALAAACTSSAGSTSAPAMKDVAGLLARHGAAVLDHDRSAFLSGISSARRSAGFRSDQEGVFDNLVALPVTTWSYSAPVRTDDASALRAATKKYRTPAVIVRVTLHYALRGADAKPTAHDLYWTVIGEHGRAVIAGDADLAANGGTSWQGPWDFGPVTVAHGRHSIVIGHEPNGAVLRTLAATVDAAVPAVTAVWGTGWSQDVAVLVPSSPAELTADAGPSTSVNADTAAVAVSDGADPLTNATFGQRLVVNPAELDRLSALGRRIIIQHEITHIATASATSGATPRWLVEGFADYVGLLAGNQPVGVAAAELRADVRRGLVPFTLPTEQSFDTPAGSAQAYEGAWLACRLISVRAGQAGLVRFYRMVGGSDDAERALSAALRAVVHTSLAGFIAQWRGYVRAQLG